MLISRSWKFCQRCNPASDSAATYSAVPSVINIVQSQTLPISLVEKDPETNQPIKITTSKNHDMGYGFATPVQQSTGMNGVLAMKMKAVPFLTTLIPLYNKIINCNCFKTKKLTFLLFLLNFSRLYWLRLKPNSHKYNYGLPRRLLCGTLPKIWNNPSAISTSKARFIFINVSWMMQHKQDIQNLTPFYAKVEDEFNPHIPYY